MPESAHPNRWFGANPQATASQGKNQHGWTRETPATWRSALGLSDKSEDREPPEGGGYWYPESPKKKGPIIAAIVILAVIAIAVGWIIGNATGGSSSQPNLAAKQDPTIAYGGRLFVSFACSACHGMQGKGGVDAAVPALATVELEYESGADRHHHRGRRPRTGRQQRRHDRSVHADLAQYSVQAAGRRP